MQHVVVITDTAAMPYRSWPYQRDRLERLAYAAGVDDEWLREHLAREVERRRPMQAR